MSTLTGAPPTGGTRDRFILVILAVLALLLYGVGLNQEIQGDDDYLYPASFAQISDAITGFDFGSAKGIGASLINLAGQVLCAPRHAPLPAAVSGVFYVLCDWLRIPFSLDLLHVPIVLASSMAVLLLYGLLRLGAGVSRTWAFAGAVMLLVSPIFTMVSRGLATYFLAFIPLTTLLCLGSLAVLARTGVPRWWMGMGLAQLVLSDVIWFVTLPLIVAAYMWWVRSRGRSLAGFLSVKILAPPVATAFLLFLGTWLAYVKGISTPFLKLLLEHGAKVSHGLPIIACPAYLVECLSLQLGVFLPFLVPVGLVVWWLAGRSPRREMALTTAFGVAGVVVYGVLFYGLSPEQEYVKHCYQIYLLLPIIFLVMALSGLMAGRGRDGTAWAGGMLVALLILEGAACVSFVWKIPVSPAGRYFEDRAHGVRMPNQGTKAAGFIVRQWIESVWRRDARLPVVVYAGRYDMSFAIFSGLNAREQGWVYHREFGPDRPIALHRAMELLRLPQSPLGTTPVNAYVLDLSGGWGGDVATCLKYNIRSTLSRDGAALVYVCPPAGGWEPPVPPGELDMSDLEARYDRTYNRYTDYFPHRLLRR